MISHSELSRGPSSRLEHQMPGCT